MRFAVTPFTGQGCHPLGQGPPQDLEALHEGDKGVENLAHYFAYDVEEHSAFGGDPASDAEVEDGPLEGVEGPEVYPLL